MRENFFWNISNLVPHLAPHLVPHLEHLGHLYQKCPTLGGTGVSMEYEDDNVNASMTRSPDN